MNVQSTRNLWHKHICVPDCLSRAEKNQIPADFKWLNLFTWKGVTGMLCVNMAWQLAPATVTTHHHHNQQSHGDMGSWILGIWSQVRVLRISQKKKKKKKKKELSTPPSEKHTETMQFPHSLYWSKNKKKASLEY